LKQETHFTIIKIEMTGSDKHSSLLKYGINYDGKKFCETGF